MTDQPDAIAEAIEGQRARVDAISAEWLECLLTAAPAERPAAEQAIAALYRRYGHPDPGFVWVDSPVSGALVVGLLFSGSDEWRAAREDPRWDVIGLQVRDSVFTTLEAAFDARRLRKPLHDLLGQQVQRPWIRMLDLHWKWDTLDQSVYQATGLNSVNLAHRAKIHHPWFLVPYEGCIPGDWGSVIEWDDGLDSMYVLAHGLPDWLERADAGQGGPGQVLIGEYDLWRRIGLVSYGEEASAILDLLVTVAGSCAWWWPFPGVCVIAERPTRAMFEWAHPERRRQPRLHCADGPALAYRDGVSTYAWHGVTVPEKVITGELTGVDWLKAGNAEVRRVIAERMGYTWLLDRCQARKVASDGYGSLWRLNSPDAEPIILVDVLNSTPEPDGSFKRYVLRVPPDQTVPRDAIGWTFGLSPGEYRPSEMT